MRAMIDFVRSKELKAQLLTANDRLTSEVYIALDALPRPKSTDYEAILSMSRINLKFLIAKSY